MGRKRKEKNRTREFCKEDINKMEIGNLSDTEFKVMIIKVLITFSMKKTQK